MVFNAYTSSKKYDYIQSISNIYRNIRNSNKKQCIYNPQKTKNHQLKKSFKSKNLQTEVYGKVKKDCVYDSTERYPRSIQVFSTDTQTSALHPTQKPVALLEYLIKTYTNEGQIVLDNCIGSGSTAIACLKTGRHYIGYELNPEYYKIAQNRILDYELDIV